MNAGTKSRGTPAVLVQSILDPRSLARLDDPDWEQLLSCARRNAVLAYLAGRADSAGIIDDFQERPRAGLLAARMAAARPAPLAPWGLDCVGRGAPPGGVTE